ncbi:hypothetical protein [Brevibacterium sp.]|uniref:hypothetical protein n=1 Tax=Brevibacterium sp. TaxID=1701 RepID=UPI0025BE0739|nr:hypothetical protein [Brevibacterium sp.]
MAGNGAAVAGRDAAEARAGAVGKSAGENAADGAGGPAGGAVTARPDSALALRRVLVGVVLAAAVMAFAFFWPVWTATWIPREAWELRMWNPTWI